MSNIIQVTNLSKSYTINHEGRERYTSLRDVIARKTKKIFSFPKSSTSASASREEFWALKDVSFNIEQGDRVGIIGRNGAGKSTLLKILSRITEPTAGEIKIKGRVASLLEVGTGFHPELTGRENVFLNGAILGMSRAEIRKHFDAIVDFAGVEKFLDTPVKRYSSGMYVRLAFAVAAHLEPEILVVDEVLAVGDMEFQEKCIGKMNEVSKSEGRTVLFVSHNMSAVSQLCNLGILLNKGTIAKTGTAAEVLDAYMMLEKNLMEVYENINARDFEIAKVYAVNENKAFMFDFSERIQINIEVKLPHKLSGLHLGVALKDKWKRKIFTTQYTIKDEEFTGGYLLKKIFIPSRLLLSGSYSLDVASFIPNSNTYTYLQDICPFKVQDLESELSIYANADVGVININCQWE